MPELILTIEGNITADPELRALPSGATVSNFTVASTPRKFDKATNEWSDEPALFMRVSCWRDLAEGAAEILRKGDSVIVKGKLKNADYEKDGVKVKAFELVADAIGKSVKARKSSGGGSWGSTPAAPAFGEESPPF